MKHVRKKMTGKKVLFTLVFIAFCASRLFVLKHPAYTPPPPGDALFDTGYSDVQHDYERYANMWRYGLTPYFEHLYEYPPATIPILSLPLSLDQAGIGYYYVNYRTQIFIFELILFVFILFTINRVPTKPLIKGIGLLFYIAAGVLAKDYWYEGLDLLFFGTVSIAIIIRYINKTDKFIIKFIFWILFWLSTSIKFLTAPLAIPLYWIYKKPDLSKKKSIGSLLKNLFIHNRQETIAAIVAFMIVWGIPLAIFRSSLSVMFVFHMNRPLKYGAFGTYIVETVNDFTHTEVQSDIPPHFPIIGPVSTRVEKIADIAFPVSAIALIIISTVMLQNQAARTREDKYISSLQITLIYILTTFITSKVFSSPFHIWYVPLITLYPFKSRQRQLIFIISAFIMLSLDTTPYIKVSQTPILGPISLDRIRGGFRFLPMLSMLAITISAWVHAFSPKD